MEGIQYGIQQGYNPMTTAYASQPYASVYGQPGQFGQQGIFAGGVSPLSGLIGSGIGGLFTGQNLGRQPGQWIDGMSGLYGSYGNVDPMTAAYVQQAQLGQHVPFGMQGQFGQQAQIASLVHQAQLAQQLAAQQQAARLAAFGVDPITAAVLQQRTQLGQYAQLNPLLGMGLNRIDPITAAYAQQAQIAQLCQQHALQNQLSQQGQFGLGQVGQGWLGGAGLWANPQAATPFGRTLPFQAGLMGAFGGFGGQLPVC